MYRDRQSVFQYANPQTFRMFEKREDLEKVYKSRCVNFIKNLDEKKKSEFLDRQLKRQTTRSRMINRKNKSKSTKRKGKKGLKTIKKEAEKTEKRESNVEREYSFAHIVRENRTSNFLKKKRWSNHMINLKKNPKKYFKDVVGDKKSVFAQTLTNFRNELKHENEKIVFLTRVDNKIERNERSVQKVSFRDLKRKDRENERR